jgi:hypothetical protein
MTDLGAQIRAKLAPLEFAECYDEQGCEFSDLRDEIAGMRAALLALLDLHAAYRTIGPIMLPNGVEGRVRLAEYAAYQEALGMAVSTVAEKLGVEVSGDAP